ncbi:ATP-binding cassette domain-containing protein [Kribbella sandramycini]|uniref:ATP-binding cassette domain-containing protein n=1 Tax=Kribbella sandramycini TaxID=60450 RepID=A0A7Y4NXC4_9ACTN|nr:ATP-binding cassette domain-containing protein [Kribbella sandramycini]MBB6568100.1 putative ABC transport system ATP-binding protein [Kribbella sandramycini]NOL39306.1 ATP-binding cassette domain-containing protein [Kribbella sandramycini]
MIAVDGVSVRYGAVTAVESVTLAVPAGRVLAVSGPSGAGKSSLLWAIAGAVAPAAGQVAVDGVQIGSRAVAAAHGVVLIPQGNGLARVLTARENLVVPLIAERTPDLDTVVTQALTQVGLAESGDHLVEELSGGEQQRVAVARGLAQRGRVVLADESTSELDGANRELVLALLRAEADRGAAVVIATHDPTVAETADAHALLDEGRLSWLRPF